MNIKSFFAVLVLTFSVISAPSQVNAQPLTPDSFAGMNEAEIRVILIDLISKLLSEVNQRQANPVAVIATNQGVIEVELFADTMPVTVNNFRDLVEKDFYDETKFHRVIEGFMIQGGDPQSRDDLLEERWGTGGPGYTIADEFVDGLLLTNKRGTVAMANSGKPNSSGSQFFINLVDNAFLDFNKMPLSSKHPVFGRVIVGMDVVDVIAASDTESNDRPVDPVVIESVAIKGEEK